MNFAALVFDEPGSDDGMILIQLAVLAIDLVLNLIFWFIYLCARKRWNFSSGTFLILFHTIAGFFDIPLALTLFLTAARWFALGVLWASFTKDGKGLRISKV